MQFTRYEGSQWVIGSLHADAHTTEIIGVVVLDDTTTASWHDCAQRQSRYGRAIISTSMPKKPSDVSPVAFEAM